MYRTTLNFHKYIEQGRVPIAYILIQTDMGWRAYAEKTLTETFDEAAQIADGTYLADGSIYASGIPIGAVDLQGRILRISNPQRTIRPSNRSISNSYNVKQQMHLSVTLDNCDDYFSRLIAKEPFLSKTLRSYVGFEALPHWESLRQFQGVITATKINANTFVIEADEQ